MNATSSQELAKQLAHRFEEMNLQDPKKRAVLSTLTTQRAKRPSLNNRGSKSC